MYKCLPLSSGHLFFKNGKQIVSIRKKMKIIISTILSLTFFASYGQGKFYGGSGSGYTSESLLLVSLYVEYSYIKAKQKGSSVLLAWQTVTEHNNDYFEIQRLNEKEAFIILAQVSGQGTSNDVNDYKWIDAAPINGINFYRIRQVDYDGKEDLSQVIAVSYLDDEIYIFPNPTRDKLYLSRIPNQALAKIYKADGQVYKIEKLESQEIPIDDLPKGLYFLSLDLRDRKIVKKFIKQ